jgi:hypothetical protein
MSKKSVAGKSVRKPAREIPAASKADLDRLRAAMHGRIDTGEISERQKFNRIRRDAKGQLPPRKSIIRDAVVGRDLMRQYPPTADIRCTSQEICSSQNS